MNIYLSLLVAVIGGLLYFIASNPRLEECGRIGFWTGLLAFLLAFGSHTASLGAGH